MWRKIQNIFLLFLIAFLCQSLKIIIVPQTANCTRKKKHFKNKNYKNLLLTFQVICNSGGLQEIPKKMLPPSVEHLSLTRNHFLVIKSDSFAGLRYLRKLSLDGNNISIIKPFAFRGLPRLRELSIQQTSLTTVSQFAFAGLQNISAIYLSYNKIKRIESYAFAGTSNLKLLVLTNNPLHKIERHAFSGLNNVERIHLPSGKLQPSLIILCTVDSVA